jgi:chemotaxis family two-component system response regulator Rcp1
MIMNILLVEDNPAEALLTREAFTETGVPHQMEVMGDGEKAMSFLRRDAPFCDSMIPDLILLDLNLPKKHGREVLREIKADEFLFKIPVIVVTNSHSREDIEEVYLLRANCYLVKPPDIDEFFLMIRRIVEFWWQTAQLPKDNVTLPPNGRNQ